jgi:uncharacterized damage-inducible protein DinB
MITLELARDLFRHQAWADASVWTALFAQPGSFGDAKLMAYARHMHGTQRAFLTLWRGEELQRGNLAERTPAEMLAWVREYHDGVLSLLDRFDQSRLGEKMAMPWMKHFAEQLGRPLEDPTIGDTLVQVPAHSTYHRGQLNARFKEIGGAPPLVDYIAWVWFGRPSPAWPS